jgi:hypothetical protein
LQRPPFPHKPNPFYYLREDGSGSGGATVKTLPWADVDTTDDAFQIITAQYGNTHETTFVISTEQFNTLLRGGHQGTWVSLLQVQQPYYDSIAKWEMQTETIGCVVSHAYCLWRATAAEPLPLYYVQFLCAPPEYIKPLLYTHLWNTHNREPTVSISLLKQEGTPLPGCRAFLTGYTHLFARSAVLTVPNPQLFTSCVQTADELRLVFEHPRLHGTSLWMICGDLPYIWEQIQNKRLFIGILWSPHNHQPIAYYFMARDWIRWSHEQGCSLELVATLSFCDMTDDLLLEGLNNVALALDAPTLCVFKITDQMENGRILRALGRAPWRSLATYYYLYNYIVPVSPPQAIVWL